MSAEANKAISRRFFEELWNDNNPAIADEIVAPDFVPHDPSNPWLKPGPAGTKELVSTYRTAFPDSHFTIEDQIAEGDRVVTRWTAHGTNNGELQGMPATGKRVTVTGITIDRIANGKLAESWVNWDTVGMLRQLGLLPDQTAAAA